MGGLLDNPNQQVVRADGSGPGIGMEGSEVEQPQMPAGETSPASLDEMTKEQLLAYGQELGISPMNAAMSKGEIRVAIDAKLAET